MPLVFWRFGNQFAQNPPDGRFDLANILLAEISIVAKGVKKRCQMRKRRPTWLQRIQAIANGGVDSGGRWHRFASRLLGGKYYAGFSLRGLLSLLN